MSCRKCTTRKILHTFHSGFARIKSRVNCFVHRYCFVFENWIVSSKSLFEILEKFFECLETQNSILKTWFSNLKTRNSKVDSRKLRGSRIEFWVQTVNLHLSGTVGLNSNFKTMTLNRIWLSDLVNCFNETVIINIQIIWLIFRTLASFLKHGRMWPSQSRTIRQC